MDFAKKPVIACVHLLPTPGSPRYDGDIGRVYDMAIADARTFCKYGVDAMIVENFRDAPFYPEALPPETIATLAGVTREVVMRTAIPVGVGALRNDAEAAMAIATAANASFIRVNVHVGAVLAEQGIIVGKSHRTLRLREALKSGVAIYADAGVKHARPFAYTNLSEEIRDLAPRCDAIIVSGQQTGLETATDDLRVAKAGSDKPVLVGTGVTPENIERYFGAADGFIVGSFFKEEGKATNYVDEVRVKAFMAKIEALRA
jgi:membrane complex biogenesis BtpA family protein